MEFDDLIDHQNTPADFKDELLALDKTPAELTIQMKDWGDPRSRDAILRSIQRMAAKETSVSGEMRVIINMMLYQQYINKQKCARLEWQNHSNGDISTKSDNFTITLIPHSRNRWQVSLVHDEGYSHPWPTWQVGIESAKRKALMCLEDAIRIRTEYRKY